MIDKFLTKVFGSSNQRYIKSLQPLVVRINELEAKVKALSDEEIRSEVRRIVEESNASGPGDFKVVMPKAMGAMRGRADGSRVQAIVREELEAKG